jgi:hypothetical protein
MTRLDNWQSNLSTLIESKRNEPFKFGTFDCSLWAGLAIEAVSGKNIYDSYLGKYTTALGALKKLKQIDKVAQPIQLFERHFGERQPIAFAKKGDLVYTSNAELDIELPTDFDTFGPVVGVCYGQNSIFVGEQGLIEINTLQLDGCLWVS